MGLVALVVTDTGKRVLRAAALEMDLLSVAKMVKS